MITGSTVCRCQSLRVASLSFRDVSTSARESLFIHYLMLSVVALRKRGAIVATWIYPACLFFIDMQQSDISLFIIYLFCRLLKSADGIHVPG